MLHSLFLIGSFGTTEILLIVFVIVFLFGAKRIPELFKGMGQGVREFKDASKVAENEQPQYRDQPWPRPCSRPTSQQYPSRVRRSRLPAASAARVQPQRPQQSAAPVSAF